MTLIWGVDIDMVNMYLFTQNEVPGYKWLKVIAWKYMDKDSEKDT